MAKGACLITGDSGFLGDIRDDPVEFALHQRTSRILRLLTLAILLLAS